MLFIPNESFLLTFVQPVNAHNIDGSSYLTRSDQRQDVIIQVEFSKHKTSLQILWSSFRAYDS